MTREAVLRDVRKKVEAACARHEVHLIVNLAMRGVPTEEIIDAYEYACEWNRVAVIAGLRDVEQAIDQVLRETDDAAAQAVPARV